MRRIVRAAAAVGLLGAGIVLGRGWTSRPGADHAAAPATGAPATSRESDDEIRHRNRAAEQEVIDREVSPLRGEADVRAYLDKLIARARARRKITALETSPGFAAINTLAGQLPNTVVSALRESFNRRVLDTIKELDPAEYAAITFVPPGMGRPPAAAANR